MTTDFSKVDSVPRLYSEYAAIPLPTSGQLFQTGDGKWQVISTWTVRDIELGEKTKFQKSCYVDTSSWSTFDTKLEPRPLNETLSAYSTSGASRAILRQKYEDPKVSSISIWSEISKIATFDLVSLDLHGQVYDDDTFGCMEWNKDENRLLYVAEKKEPSLASYFKLSLKKEDKESKPPSLDQNTLKEDWGETLTGKIHPVIWTLDIKNKLLKPNELPSNLSSGQAIWGPNNEIVCVGWDEEPRRLGMVYCTNRKSAIYCINLDDQSSINFRQNENESVWSPRFNPQQTTLVYFMTQALGPHRDCTKLMKIDWQKKIPEVVVDVVPTSQDDDFPGIYTDSLPSNCWTKDGNWLIFPSQWRSKLELIGVNVNTGKVIRLTNDETIGSYQVLDIKENLLLAKASSINVRPYLMIGELEVTEENLSIKGWHKLSKFLPETEDFTWKVLKHRAVQNDPTSEFESILVSNLSEEPKPLIIWPHGGPHSAFSCSYSFYVTLFLKLNYEVLLVNYRGSLGFGRDQLYSLLGNIGTQDVSDVKMAIEAARKLRNPNKLIIFGGSHGGFLGAHLSHVDPDLYQVCILRNPVIDIPGMMEQTDIPDWSMVESGFQYTDRVNFQHIEKMWDCSPIKYTDKVKVPTMLLLGKKDRRVPMSQGLKYYYRLKSMNIPTRVLIYDDCHALGKVDVESDVFINTIDWIENHN